MSYRSFLKESEYFSELPIGLQKHVLASSIKEISVEYILPKINDDRLPPIKKDRPKLSIDKIRLPARINSPLIPYPEIIRQYISHGNYDKMDIIHPHHAHQLSLIVNMISSIRNVNGIISKDIKYGINDLKAMLTLKTSNRSEIINHSVWSFAERATTHDLCIATMEKTTFKPVCRTNSRYISFLSLMQKLRMLACVKANSAVDKESNYKISTSEASYKLFNDGTYMYSAKSNDYTFCLIVAGGHFSYYHNSVNYWFTGSMSYLDYALSTADIFNNIDVILTCDEYNWSAEVLTYFMNLAEKNLPHNLVVEFMKCLEGFILNLSDYDEDYAMNWAPIMLALVELIDLDAKLTNTACTLDVAIGLIQGKSLSYSVNSLLAPLIIIIMKLNRVQRQEVSSLHKFIFFAEVDSAKGIEKFLKRVHTKRPMDNDAIKNLTRLAKREFLLSYRSKHNSLPNMIIPARKKMNIEMYHSQNRQYDIANLPLTWWDEVTIYKCMDNTQTDDPLEYSKDKGALKERVTYGPGDSRKELLQVIEKEKYEIKDLMDCGPFIPLPPKVTRCRQMKSFSTSKHNVRLIEKEREQKIEARLFANAELSNKHGLSVIALKIKKALSYFSEQLMTPSDSHRKQLLHDAAQDLIEPTNFSLLLDIEGHNQSMQYENTSELLEFCGNLFGENGWGELANYFSILNVYHYDEYLDEVVVSNGQYGGIEGWLNPLWTMHTTLMMKLLRIMTDIELPKIMVYSDDVNAIIKIKQPSEETIQATFTKVLMHCIKFGMVIKYSQTNLSKHRVTMLRQHYADGERSDSTLKRLLAVSGMNNPMLFSEEIEVAGICSSTASALELSNHSTACCLVKNYKLGLLLIRLPHQLLSMPQKDGMLSMESLPSKLSSLLYHIKDDTSYYNKIMNTDLIDACKNDVRRYLEPSGVYINKDLLDLALRDIYSEPLKDYKYVDDPDRLLYLQIYDDFITDLLFFLIYTPASTGGLGGVVHLDMMLSGHSNGTSKSIHYIKQWIFNFSCNIDYFSRYLTTILSYEKPSVLLNEERAAITSSWHFNKKVTTASTSINSAIKNLVSKRTKNTAILKLVQLDCQSSELAEDLVSTFRTNFHPRVAQFYYENSSVHFLDLLLNKIETSSGLLSFVASLSRLRVSLAFRTLKNIRTASVALTHTHASINKNDDIIDLMIHRRSNMFPKISFIEVEEILYDDKISIVKDEKFIIAVTKSSPYHFKNGYKIKDTPQMANEVTYKGDIIDAERMIGNKEELLAAKLVSITKWLLIKSKLSLSTSNNLDTMDCVKACNLSLSTLTGQTFRELMAFSPDETGGEILHRIPNMRFNTTSIIRSEMNRSLTFTTHLTQTEIFNDNLLDSNINFDYLRLRLLLASLIASKHEGGSSIVRRYKFDNLIGVKDVQFVSPKLTTYTSQFVYKSYGLLKNHTFSELKFRYFAYTYLSTIDLADLGVMPNLLAADDIKRLGESMAEDIIYRYSRALDREYMALGLGHFDISTWAPILTKLQGLDDTIKGMNDNEKMVYIKVKLEATIHKTKIRSTKSFETQVLRDLQIAYIDRIITDRPCDNVYSGLQKKLLQLSNKGIIDKRSENKIKHYQSTLHRYGRYRREFTISLLMEYIVTCHFNVSSNNGVIRMSVESSINEMIESGISQSFIMLLSLDLYAKMYVIGFEYIISIMSHVTNELTHALYALSNEIVVDDISTEKRLPSMMPCTKLRSDLILPSSADLIIYEMVKIDEQAMSSFVQIKGLAKFAKSCVESGAHPDVFMSPTGSDSYMAQYGLFKCLKSIPGFDESTKICDLTAGRGDGLYAARALSLDCTSYSRQDTFTQIFHHPDITFRNDYNVFDTSTVKFALDYDFVHIDISFTKSDESNILDLILMLETNSIAYSIRINSVLIDDYVKSNDLSLPNYEHFIAYASNSGLKPYQLYLVGMPGGSFTNEVAKEFRHTTAFRSIATSFYPLLSNLNHQFRSIEWYSNSINIYMPHYNYLPDLLKYISTGTRINESVYYLQRFCSEMDTERCITFSDTYTTINDFTFTKDIINRCEITKYPHYIDTTLDDIGNVSEQALPYHEKHLIQLHDSVSNKYTIKVNDHDVLICEHFRRHHPLQSIRSNCNVIMGIQKFVPQALEMSGDEIQCLSEEMKSSNPYHTTFHQREIHDSIKLLILAASRNDYAYGVRYCYLLIKLSNSNKHRAMRMLKNYRLLSAWFEPIQQQLTYGIIPIRNLNAIENDLIIRRIEQVKRSQGIVNQTAYKEESHDITMQIDLDFDKIFDQLSANASLTILDDQTLSYDPGGKPMETEYMVEISSDTMQNTFGSLTSNLNISDVIDNALKQMTSYVTRPDGTIDLGDDIDEYDPDD